VTRHYPTQIHECELCGRAAPAADKRLPEGTPAILCLYLSIYFRQRDGRKLSNVGKIKVCSRCLREAHKDAHRPVAIGSGRKLAQLVIDRLQARYNEFSEAKIA
jgi:hypothetical protein